MASEERLLSKLKELLEPGIENVKHVSALAKQHSLEGKSRDAKLRDLVKTLVEEKRVPVCSSKGGYYLGQSAEDLEATIKNLQQRENSIRKRRLVLENLALGLTRKVDQREWKQAELF